MLRSSDVFNVRNWSVTFGSTVQVLVACFTIAVAGGNVATAKNIKAIEEPSPGDRVVRSGNTIHYYWQHYDEFRKKTYTLDFGLVFYRGLSYMQNAYSRLDHDHDQGEFSYKHFIWGDPFYQDLRIVANALMELADQNRLSRMAVALSFVQSLPYSTMRYYQRYALETLIDGTGDCSDTSVLLGGILQFMRIPWVFLEFKDHLAIGAWPGTNNFGGRYYNVDGRFYFYCESTGKGWQVGDVPEDYIGLATAIIKSWTVP